MERFDERITFDELVDLAPHTVKRKLEQLKFMKERPDFHPEPNVYAHIKIVTERLMKTGDADLVMAGMLHDICKLDTVRENKKTGWPTSPGHDKEAHNLIKELPSIQGWITSMNGNPDTVANICLNHMRFHQLEEMREAKRKAQIEKWIEEGIYDQLVTFGRADDMLTEFKLD